MLKDFTPRLYQEKILYASTKQNTLVVLPTGLGKTALAFMLAAHRLHTHPGSKILVLSPTRPLCEQHAKSFQKHLVLPDNTVHIFTGMTKPAVRKELFAGAKVIIATPQGVENDLINNNITLEQVTLMVFDEAHHATGDYSYVWIAQRYMKQAKFPHVLALTASPGSDMESIQEVCHNLFIERVEVRTDDDEDVRPYIQEITRNNVMVDFPQEFKAVHHMLKTCSVNKLDQIRDLGIIRSTELSKTEILQLQSRLSAQLSQGQNFEAMRAISLLAEALKVQHAVELVETQGIPQLYTYLHSILTDAESSKVKAVRNLAKDPLITQGFALTKSLLMQGTIHPKMIRLQEIVASELGTGQAIIFTQYRDTGAEIVKLFGEKARLFVGQAKRGATGSTQKQQREIIEAFRNNAFQLLVCTSVGEEGLDIPTVDFVIFYEPVPSAIRQIQRRGRTGRHNDGKVFVLITKGTRDEQYRWSAHYKEKRMHSLLKTLNLNLTQRERPMTLQDFQEKVKIVVDFREKASSVIKELIELGADISLSTLESADYLCSGEVAVEYKTSEDFVQSIIDGRLLSQLKELKIRFKRPLLLVEQNKDIYTVRQVHPNAIRGMLATIVTGFGIPVLFTKDAKDSAAMLLLLAKREQVKETDVSLHPKKGTDVALQEYIVAALPGIGYKTAVQLLKKFETIEGVFAASTEELQEVDGVGKVTAQRIRAILQKKYGEVEKSSSFSIS